jgi:hypothetical protein
MPYSIDERRWNRQAISGRGSPSVANAAGFLHARTDRYGGASHKTHQYGLRADRGIWEDCCAFFLWHDGPSRKGACGTGRKS